MVVRIDPAKDYYGILEVASNASLEDVRAAYRRQALRYHPDTGHGDAGHFRLIREAYEILSDPAYRRAYDRQRAARGLTAAAPVGLSLLQSRTELLPIDGEQMLYVLLDVHARALHSDSQTQLNLVLVVDCSTSMQGARMHNVKVAISDLIDALSPEDRLALVTFSDRAEVVADLHYASEQRVLRSALSSMAAEGGTEIYQGLVAGIEILRRHPDPGGVNHVLLFTDGRTYGDEDLALTTARRAAATGIGISAFGIGEDWNDMFLDDLASSGGGTSQYISAPSKVRCVLNSQIADLANLALRNARLKLNTASCVRLEGAYRATPHMEILPAGQGDTISVGGITSAETSELVLELAVHETEPGEHRLARLELTAEEVASREPVRLLQDVDATFTYTPREREVPPRMLNTLARLSVFRLQEQAWRALESGDSSMATKYLQSAATRLFDLGYQELGNAAMLEVTRLARGSAPSVKGRKVLRYGTRALST
ncbi:MAG: VWA domain-containing protein [Anaerolineae bacterium]